MIGGLLKPHYLRRPRQAARRLRQALAGAPPAAATVTLPWGLPLTVDPREDVGGAIWRQGLYDLALSETLWRLIEPGDVAVDVGANLGYTASLMARRAGPGGRVLAFEPHPEVVRRLQQNVAAWATRRDVAPVEIAAVALAAHAGRAHLDCGAGFASNQGTARLVAGGGPLAVAVTTLDAVLAGLLPPPAPVRVVKIDVEGGEPEVLAGAAGALAAGSVQNFVYEAFAAARRPLAELLRAAGYEVVALGWTWRGLALSAPDAAPRLPPYEPHNFLATRDPRRVLARLRAPGWEVLRGPHGAAR
jgi:FkbM family methyltransferase